MVQPGEIAVLDRASPSVRQTSGPSRSLLLEIPRERLESLLGDARHFAALTIGRDLGSARLVTTFLDTLLHVETALTAGWNPRRLYRLRRSRRQSDSGEAERRHGKGFQHASTQLCYEGEQPDRAARE